jgi:hypothetical protein
MRETTRQPPRAGGGRRRQPHKRGAAPVPAWAEQRRRRRDTASGFDGFVWAWNNHQGRGTPALHTEMATWLQQAWDGGRRRLLLLVFRDAGKSTLVGLFCAWLLSRDANLRILVLSAEGALAAKMTRNVRRVIELHPMTRHLLPERREQWASDQITVRRGLNHRDPSLLARGIGANITGSRADVVVCDDVEVPNTTGTPDKRASLRERLREMGFVLVPGGAQLYVGTPHSYYSIYADEPRAEAGEDAPFLDGFDRLTLPLLDAEGRSRWPERFTPEAVERLRAESGPARFRSQMLLLPTHAHEVRLDPDRLVRYAGEIELSRANGAPRLAIEGRRMAGAACFWDPAFGRPGGRGDASVVACVFTDEAGGYWLHAIEYLRFDPARVAEADPATQLCRGVADFLARYEQPAVTVETNGLGRFLPGLLRRELKARGVAAAVGEHVSTRAKEQRILDALDPLLAAGALRAHARVWDTPFVREMREWLPGGRGADDGLDAVSGCILAQPVRLGGGPAPVARRSDWRGGAAYKALTEP